jgi:urease subunit alpha
LAFVSGLSLASGTVQRYGLHKPLVAVKGCRTLGKRDMKLNDALPQIRVDAETYSVTADGEPLSCAPLDVLPLAQRYFLF